jgi:hypothetical protein
MEHSTRFNVHPGNLDKLRNRFRLPRLKRPQSPTRREPLSTARPCGTDPGCATRFTDPLFRGPFTVTLPASAPKPLTLGFLAVLQDASGWLGGYLVTNGWGRPLEFRLTTAVQPNRVQTALYGSTLTEYLHADVIGKTLVEKTGTKPDLIVTDSPPALALRSRIEIPVIAIQLPNATLPPDAIAFAHPRSPGGLFLPARFAADRDAVAALLDRVDSAVDLAEPFARVREAVGEARKMGVTNRAAA